MVLLLCSMLGALGAPVDLDEVLASELDRALAVYADSEDTPYYIALTLEDSERTELGASDGTIATRRIAERHRFLDVDLRVGSPEFDSTHALRGFSSIAAEERRRLEVAWDGPGEERALRHALWRELDDRHRASIERLVLLRGEATVRVEEENPADDFEVRDPIVAAESVGELDVDEVAWTELLVAMSERLTGVDAVYEHEVRLSARRQAFTFVDTEGTRVQHGRVRLRLAIQAIALGDDGDEVTVFEAIDVHSPDSLPERDRALEMASQVVRELETLVAAPRVGPYQGPVLLSGKASGVFFHEVMGHRVEGHRQRSDSEGKTFLEFVGRSVLPDFIDVYDDPTITRLAGHDLNGNYAYDDEGVPGQRAELVDDGVFQGFLMGRTPVEGFPTSNGHGRRSTGNASTSRMGNTIIEVDGGLPEHRLVARLLAEAREQDLDYAYVVEEIEGGFTMTGRVMPNSFNVRATRTRRVWVDGRPDEIVRGIDLVGTPLVAFRSIVAGGDTPEVFNGTCGAESGWVPVSAVAPSILFSRLEFQLKEKGSRRPPLLEPPRPDDASTALEVTP